MELRVNFAKMCFRGGSKMTREAPKASQERPDSTLEHAGNVPGASLERPERILGALRHPLERSKEAPERLGGDLERKMASLKAIFEVITDTSWLFQAMYRFCVHRFSNAIELTRVVNAPPCYLSWCACFAKTFCSISF